MGACFSKVFNGCPLHVNCTASWIHPYTNGRRFIIMVLIFTIINVLWARIVRIVHCVSCLGFINQDLDACYF